MVLKLSQVILKRSQSGAKCPPPASPSPASAKVSCQAVKKTFERTILMIFYNLYEKVKKSFTRGLNKGSVAKK